jgi:hypothetical protein
MDSGEIGVEIKVCPNVEMAEIPLNIDLREGACLREALSMVAPQIINETTGEYIDDPDFWDIRLNEELLYRLKNGLDTRMREGDVIRLEIIFHLS